MKMYRQRGILLLPVALTLAIVGALAYTMTREGSIDVSTVDARYDTEVARYLAEAGLNLAKWQNEKLGCSSERGFGTVTLPGGRIVSGTMNRTNSGNGKRNLSINLTATTDRSAVRALADVVVPMYDLTDVDEDTFDSGYDVSIRNGSGNQSGFDYLEASDGKSHALVAFDGVSKLGDVTVISAYLKLTQYDTKSTQPVRSLAVHRVTRAWLPISATWNTALILPWSTPGGDYEPVQAATVAIAGNAQYTWRIDALVQDWANRPLFNYGVLLRPSGLLDARFGSFERSGSKPQLTVRYFPRC
jgi:hypothetical protein